MQTLFDAVAKGNPAKAIEYILKISQFILPAPPQEPIENKIDNEIRVIIVHPPKEETD